MGCGVICVKYLMFFFNVLFAITGLIILGAGAFIQASYYHYSDFLEGIWVAPIIFMVVGIVVFIIAFFGCCGAVKENSCMVLTFSILLALVFIVEIGIGIAGYVKHSDLENMMEKGFNHTMENYSTNKEYQASWSFLQSELVCCGVNGPNDWQPIFHNDTIPKSCCKEFEIDVKTCSNVNAFKEGCMPKLFNLLNKKALILGGVGIGIALTQLVGVIFACCLSTAFRRNYETV